MSRSIRKINVAIGNGNCPFNAFILAFTNDSYLRALESHLEKTGTTPDEQYKLFIDLVAFKLKITADWKTVKKTLLKMDPESLQLTLAPILREFSLSLVSKDQNHCVDTYPFLLGAFRNFICNKLKIPLSGHRDDIFERHEHIRKEFESLFGKVASNLKDFPLERYKKLKTQKPCAELKELENQFEERILASDAMLFQWWENQGHQKFVSAMAKEKIWAGDLELLPLAQYFNTTLHVLLNGKKDCEYEIYKANNNIKPLVLSHAGGHWNSTFEKNEPELKKANAEKKSKKANQFAAIFNATLAIFKDNKKKDKESSTNKWEKMIQEVKVAQLKELTTMSEKDCETYCQSNMESRKIDYATNHLDFYKKKSLPKLVQQGQVLFVDVKTQIELDEALAKKLQQEEYKAYKKSRI